MLNVTMMNKDNKKNKILLLLQMSTFKDGDHAVLTCHDRTRIVQIRQGR